MVHSEKTYSLLKMIYKNVAYVTNNLYYVSNDKEIIDNSDGIIIEWSAYGGYVINTEDNSKIFAQYILLKVIDNYKLVLIRTNNKEENYTYDTLIEKAYLYDVNTDELLADASEVSRIFLWVTNVIHLKDSKLLLINDDTIKLDHNVILVDLNKKEVVKTDKIVNVKILDNKVIITTKGKSNVREQHEYYRE